MGGMAVKLDVDALCDSVAPAVREAAQRWLASGRVGEITAVGGGASASVDHVTVWVGIVGGDFVAECDCTDVPPGAVGARNDEDDDLCAHAVALTVAAGRAGFPWSSSATPPSRVIVDPQVRQLTDLAATLPARRLAALVGEYAASDRKLETKLRSWAGELGSPSPQELAAVRKTISRIAAEATRGRWGLEDVARAGRLIVDELETLAQRPANPGAVTVVEGAAEWWDELSVHLHGAYSDNAYAEDPEVIGDAIRAVHVLMCEQVDVDPDELAARLATIMGKAEISSCLDAPDDYAALLGPDPTATRRW